MVALSLIGHAVEVTQVSDVPRGRNAVACLHATQLAHREQKPVGGLLDGEAFLGPELAQEGT
jgi:hypothetical protein